MNMFSKGILKKIPPNSYLRVLLKVISQKIEIWDMTRHVQQRYNYLIWKIKGKPLPPPSLEKQKIVRECAKKNHLNILVETGTGLGDMINSTKRIFKTLM